MSYRGGSGNASSQTAAFKRMLNDVRSNKTEIKLNGLETIAEQIAFSDGSSLRNFPVQEACKEFVKIVQNSNDMAVLTLTTQCIVNLLDSIPDSSRQLTNFNYIQIAKEKMQYELSKGVLENIIHSLCTLTKTRAREVGQLLGVKFILKNLETLSGPEKHYAVAAMARFTSYYATSKFAQSLPTIANYFTSNDEQIVHNMLSTFTNILNAVGFSDVPKETIEIMCVSLSIATNPKIILQILTLLQRLIFHKEFGECLIETNLNYENFLTNTDFGNDFPKIRLTTMQIIRSLLPSPNFPTGFWESERAIPSNCEKLAKEVQPILVKLSLQKSSDLNYVYANLAMSLKLSSESVPSQIYPILIASSQDTKLAPFVLLLALNLPDKNMVNSSGLTAHLAKIKLGPSSSDPESESSQPTNINQWYRHNIGILRSLTGLNRTKFAKPSSFKKFNDIFEFIDTSTMSAFELQAAGYIDRFLELMRMEGLKNTYDFSHIRDILHQIITYSNIPELIDPFESHSSREFANGSIIVDVKCNNKTYKNKKFENESLFIAIEAWYNETINHVTTNDMLDAARISGRLGQIVSLEHAQNITYTHIGILHRAFGTKNYQRYSFKMSNKKYSACDNLFQSIARSLSSPESWPIVTPSIELIEESNDSSSIVMSPLDVPRNNVPNKVVFEILQLIHIYSPEIDLYSVEFENALSPHLKSFFLDIGLFSPAVQIAVNYPFLFNFEFRSIVVRLIAPDFFSALSFAQKSIFESTEKLRDGRMFNHCTVTRSNLFDDGVILMNSIAKGPLQLDICFENEAGFGVGPTKEFFSALAIEFTRNRTKMWRSDNITSSNTVQRQTISVRGGGTSNNSRKKKGKNRGAKSNLLLSTSSNSPSFTPSEFAWTKIGLFPQYGANPEYFFALGVLCAKAVAMNSVLSIPFSVEFFKLIKGEHLTMEEIDSAYAQSLKSREGLVGLQFVYPGNENIELVPGGKLKFVTMDNVDEYVKLVEDFVFGSKLQPIRQSFCDGFNTVFQRGIWNLFEARELRTLIAGEEVNITMKDLTNYVEISHGYESNSPQIKMLFDILVEFDNHEKSLFVKFITGSERLPIGGLASLQPQLAVAKKIDESIQNQDDALPSVMTCTHYFKLPPYSTKEKMKEKILLAITEGQGAFLLT
ncbi:hypothetical protein M9Y10_023227 [Tritrichomonas musculus]|uniref:HECT-type E3 ubiquitin transferase n=1 Tax=Tritrichomonas musculus TaxID=1915356 RepID=A0ABR2KUJ7_9EUKA